MQKTRMFSTSLLSLNKFKLRKVLKILKMPKCLADFKTKNHLICLIKIFNVQGYWNFGAEI